MRNMKYIKNIALLTLIAGNLIDEQTPEVYIVQGTLTGKTSLNRSYYEYLGIPYATTNSIMRFKAPLPPPSWKGIFRATDDIYQCPQPGIIGVLGVEDCLKINIYKPIRAKGPLAVMVFIHGGSFSIGNGAKTLYGPEFFIKQEVILVTFNYRLGALGFLCLGIKKAPGNAGLKDQIAALKWVNENIAAFGGDKDKITIFGLSAGAVSASILLTSKAARGLFQRAIIMSGVASASWAVNRQPLFTASLIAKELGYNTTDPHEIYKIFSEIHYTDLVTAIPTKPIGKYFDIQLLNYPCIERAVEGEEIVLSDLPYNLLSEYSNEVSIMYGMTSKEGLLILAHDSEESLKERDSKYIFAPDLEFSSEDEAERTSQKLKYMYLDKAGFSFLNRDKVIEFYTHMYFEVPTLIETERIVSTTRVPVYNYYFNYSGGRNFLKYIYGYFNETGACHGDELMYIFKGLAWPFAINSRDQIMIDRMTKMFTDFAKYGDSTPIHHITKVPLQWKPSTKDSLKLMHIDDDLKMGTMPNPYMFKLWKDIYRKHRKTNELNDF